MASKLCIALIFILGNKLHLGNSFFVPSAFHQHGWKRNVCSIFGTTNEQKGTFLLSMSAINDTDEKLNVITKSLIKDKEANYWSDQLNEEQWEDAKFAIQEWAKGTLSKKSPKQKTTEYMEQILKRLGREKANGNDLVELDVGMYELLIDAWCKLDLPERAESILNEIQSINAKIANKIELNITPYNTIIHSYKRMMNGEKAEHILRMIQKANIDPDEISYNGVIAAHARNYKQNGSADKARRILEEMEKVDVEMDIFLFNTVMDAYAKSSWNDGLSAKKAEALLDKLESLENIQPNTISYTSVIDAYAKSNFNDRADSAERVFRKMEAAHKAGNENAEPNVRSFNAGELAR